MDLKQHYDTLYRKSVQKMASDTYQMDTLIDSLSDNRFGITVLIRPDSQTKKNIQSFIEALRQIDPEQYYYPSSDIHITVLSIISCYDGFDLARVSIADHVTVIEKSLVEIPQTAIHFQGITASASAIMVQGFANSGSLNDFRNNLRANYMNSGLEQSIDQRYSIHTAHATVVRFRKEISHKEKFMETLEKYRDFEFGTFSVEKYQLVYNDWYQRERFVRVLHEFQQR